MNQNNSPENLPRCKYPKASELKDHGLYDLPSSLTPINWSRINKYRSQRYKTVSTKQLSYSQIIEMAKMIAKSFAKNEPMKAHLRPPLSIPLKIKKHTHQDPFGRDDFGAWTGESIVFWYMRLFILTKPTDTIKSITVNNDSINLSVAIVNKQNIIIGGALNNVVKSKDLSIRRSDPFLDAVMLADKPIFDLISSLERIAIEALIEKYPDFLLALTNAKVGEHSMIARSEELPKEDTFELVAASAEALQNQGYQFMMVTASNQWTGAACEALNGTRVHFIPFRNIQRVPDQSNALSSETSSSDGYISAKDSGAMFYIIKLY